MKNTTIGKMIITGTAVMAAIITGCSRKVADIPNVDITAEISGEDAVSTEADEVNSVHSTTEGTSTAATKKSEVNSVHSTTEGTSTDAAKKSEVNSVHSTAESTKAPEAQSETTTQEAVQTPTKAPEAQPETTTQEAVQEPTKAPEAQPETTTQEAVREPTKAPEAQPETTTEAPTTAPEAQPETTTQAPTEEVTEPSSEPALSDEEILANTPTYGDTYNVVVNGTRYYWKYDVGSDGAFLSTGRWMSETEYFAYLDEKQREYESELESRRAISWYDTHSEELGVAYYDEHGLGYVYYVDVREALPAGAGISSGIEDMGEFAEGRVKREYNFVTEGWTYKNGKDVQNGMVRIEEQEDYEH